MPRDKGRVRTDGERREEKVGARRAGTKVCKGGGGGMYPWERGCSGPEGPKRDRVVGVLSARCSRSAPQQARVVPNGHEVKALGGSTFLDGVDELYPEHRGGESVCLLSCVVYKT